MSFDIYVLVPARSWPTARQLDDALLEAGYPVRLGDRSPLAWDAPLAPVAAEPIRFTVQDANQAQILGQPVGAEMEMPHEIVMPVVLDDVVLDPDFCWETLTDVASLNSQLEDIQAGAVAEIGDHLVWFSHHVDQRNYNAGMYILAALILRFDGYGFEMQGASHGREAFVRELLESLYPEPVENPLADLGAATF
ncbi:MAG: hypothetical protein ABIS51_04100 [Sphingomonas sp.]